MENSYLKKIIDNYTACNQVQAVALGGSASAKTADSSSDIDVYVFVTKEIEVPTRTEIVEPISSKFEVGGEYFGSGDEYFVDTMGTQLDVMYWNTSWFEQVIKNCWEQYVPSNGYTTCFVYTLQNLDILYDKDHWLQTLKNKINSPYPQTLRKNIIKRNIMLLKDKPFASYYEQIQKAILRNDLNSINHRIAAFLASYFDIIFALNEMLHPGEKRLIHYALEHCKILPKDFEQHIETLLKQSNPETLMILDHMVSNLKERLLGLNMFEEA